MSFPKAAPPQPPFQLLEINLISAQDLAPISRSMSTYAVAWVHPERKLTTRVDTHGHADPTWNDKFVFRVDDEFLQSDTSAVMIEIYALRWFRDVRVGTVRVLVGNLIPPSTRHHIGMRFIALQVRRPSGRPQGILNIGVALLDSSMRSMPLYTQIGTSALGYRDLMGEKPQTLNHHHHHNDDEHHPSKIQLRRTKSERSEAINDDMSQKAGSIINGSKIQLRRTRSERSEAINDYLFQKPGSIINGSEVGAPPLKMITTNGSVYAQSELGPAPSIVAEGLREEYFQKVEMGSSILEDWSVDDASVEGLKSKLERWRTELPPIYDRGYKSYRRRGDGHVRRHTDGEVGGGLFTCFGSTCGCECAISCGPGARKKKGQLSPSESLLLPSEI